MDEPTTGATPRPCSTPHSAPVAWLKTCPEPVEGSEPPKASAKAPREPDAPEPAPKFFLPATAATRHDGWTGEKMAIFCETLAETAVVAEGCEAARMSISGAYAARRRNPIFAAAWDAALTIARERLADTLLARSMEGNIEQVWRDGVIVGERHVIDNRLGLAILRRLDRLAEGAFASARATCPSPANAEARGCSAEASTGRRRSTRSEPATMTVWRAPLHSPKVTKWRKWKR